MSDKVDRSLNPTTDPDTLPNSVSFPAKYHLPRNSPTCRTGLITLVVFTALVIYFSFFCNTVHNINPLSFPKSFYTPPDSTSSQNVNLLDIWQESWTDPRLLSSSPLGDFLPPAIAKVQAHQNPFSCRESSFLLFEYYSELGFGAVARHFVTALHVAIHTNRVLVIDQSRRFYWAIGCPQRYNGRHECYFRPISDTCSYKTVMRLVSDKTLPLVTIGASTTPAPDVPWPFIPHAREHAPDVVRFRMPELPEPWFRNFLYGYTQAENGGEVIRDILADLPEHVHRKYLTPDSNARRTWLIALAYYFLRLNNKTANFVRAEIQFLLKTSSPMHERFIGLPVRASDKCHGNALGSVGEMNCVTLAEVMLQAHMLALGETIVTKAIITSEDPTAITPEKIAGAQGNITFHEPLAVVLNTHDEVAGTGAPSKRITLASNAKLLKASLVTLHLQSQAAYHILTPRSTFSSLIAAFAKTVPGKRHHTFLAVGEQKDLNNSLRSQFM